ncbi:Unknown protein sequence [Pseudomonas syringae pv. syringae]|nr:Unknown protein sequence [Pseudomonas syringae pv. syringae]
MSDYRLLPENGFFQDAAPGGSHANAFRLFPALQVVYSERQNADICPA